MVCAISQHMIHCFTIQQCTIHAKIIQISLSYSEETINTMQLEQYFAEQKTGSCCVMHINLSPHHMEFSDVFINMINIYIVTELLVSIVFRLLI